MKPGTIARIIRNNYFKGSLRGTYWGAAALAGEIRSLFQANNRAFRHEVWNNQRRFVFSGVTPIAGKTGDRARAAVRWLLRAQSMTQDDGVSLGYFPCTTGDNGWRLSYPETTGYIISSLLEFAEQFDDRATEAAAMRMAHWEISVQMPSGAVQGGPVCAPEHQTAAAFNTGMVLDGWCTAYRHSHDPKLLEAARHAADFLVNDVDELGYFKTNGAFVSAGEIKTYTCLCAWSIYQFGDLIEENRYRLVAIQVIEAALRQQQPNGWFDHNCLTHSESPLTHTIGYTLQGILEVGILAGRQDFIVAVRKTMDALLSRMSSNGFLPGRFFADWEPAGFSSCLTGSAQIAIVCYRLFEQTDQVKYRTQGDTLVNYLKALQVCQSEEAGMTGAMAGSFPIFGAYMRAGYPNWATKYYLDALMLQDRLNDGVR